MKCILGVGHIIWGNAHFPLLLFLLFWSNDLLTERPPAGEHTITRLLSVLSWLQTICDQWVDRDWPMMDTPWVDGCKDSSHCPLMRTREHQTPVFRQYHWWHRSLHHIYEHWESDWLLSCTCTRLYIRAPLMCVPWWPHYDIISVVFSSRGHMKQLFSGVRHLSRMWRVRSGPEEL